MDRSDLLPGTQPQHPIQCCRRRRQQPGHRSPRPHWRHGVCDPLWLWQLLVSHPRRLSQHRRRRTLVLDRVQPPQCPSQRPGRRPAGSQHRLHRYRCRCLHHPGHLDMPCFDELLGVLWRWPASVPRHPARCRAHRRHRPLFRTGPDRCHLRPRHLADSPGHRGIHSHHVRNFPRHTQFCRLDRW